MNDDERYTRPMSEILDRVYKRGRVLRRRRVLERGLATAPLAVLVSGSMVAVMLGATGKPVPPAHETVAPPKPAGSEPPKPPATESPTPKPTVSSTPKPKPPYTPKPTATATPKPECINSFDPACGEFSWKTKPASNQPMVLNVTAPEFVAGEAGELAVSITDPDAWIARRAYKVDFGDYTKVYDLADKECKKGYGPWTTPVAQGDGYERSFVHTYASPGTYTVTVYWWSLDRIDGTRPCQTAYGSSRTAQITVTVTPPPEPPPAP